MKDIFLKIMFIFVLSSYSFNVEASCSLNDSWERCLSKKSKYKYRSTTETDEYSRKSAYRAFIDCESICEIIKERERREELKKYHSKEEREEVVEVEVVEEITEKETGPGFFSRVQASHKEMGLGLQWGVFLLLCLLANVLDPFDDKNRLKDNIGMPRVIVAFVNGGVAIFLLILNIMSFF